MPENEKKQRDIKLRVIVASIITISLLSFIFIIINALIITRNYAVDTLSAYNLPFDQSSDYEDEYENNDDTDDSQYGFLQETPDDDSILQQEPDSEETDTDERLNDAYREETFEYNLQENNDYLIDFHENINDDVSYRMDWLFDHYESVYGNVAWTISYYELSGDIPNIDLLNQAIYSQCAYLPEQYLTYYEKDDPSFTSYYDAKGTSYITYNDEDIISILSIQNGILDDSESIGLMSMNIDLHTGTILNNSDIFYPDKEFSTRFREQSSLQNGDSEELDRMSDEEIMQYLTDDDTSIVFYSEKGLEVGFQYYVEQEDGYAYSGYITITLNDYQKYIR